MWSGDGALPLPELVDDGRAAGVSTDAPEAAQDPDHVPIHNAGSLGRGAGVTVPGDTHAPSKARSWGAPRTERGHTGLTHRPSWLVDKIHCQAGEPEPSTALGSLWLENQQQDLLGAGLGGRERRHIR